MKSVTVKIESVVEGLELVDQVRSSGLNQHVDFEFSYNQPRYDLDLGEVVGRSITFDFNDERNAVFFILRWT